MTALILQILVSIVLFAGVFLPIYAIFRYPVATEPPIHRRIAAAVGANRDTVFENPLIAPVMSLGLNIARRFNWPTLRDKIRQDLAASGNPSGYSVDEYLAIAITSSLGLGMVTLVLDVLLGGGQSLVLFVPVMAVLGFYAPLWSVSSAASRRVARISKQLPYTLDLIALVMAAGSSFTEAIETLIRDNPDDDLNQELGVVLSEIEFGTTRKLALEHLAERIPLESLRSVIGAINQAEALGTPLSQILKLQSDMLRMHRGVRAEKLSASASLRILIPSMLILLAVVVIVFAPMLIEVLRRGSLF